ALPPGEGGAHRGLRAGRGPGAGPAASGAAAGLVGRAALRHQRARRLRPRTVHCGSVSGLRKRAEKAGWASRKARRSDTGLTWPVVLERVTGIEPALSAWEADVLPLNYTRRTCLRWPALGGGPRARLPDGDAGWRCIGGRGVARDADWLVGPRVARYGRWVLLSDKDLRSEIGAGRVRVEPFDDSMVQPSSIDVRLDRFFRVFENHRYPHIDPAQEQPDLTRLVEPEGDEPFILHPGEFVLGSTYEVITLPDDIASR